MFRKWTTLAGFSTQVKKDLRQWGVTITIQDALGRKMYQQNMAFTNQKLEVHPTPLSAGIYLLQITDATGKTTNFKFVVQ